MSESEKKSRCWGCGRDLGACICDGKPVPLTIKPPNEILPFCKGGHGNEPWEDLSRSKEVMLRPCCVCNKYWMCDYKEWLNGDCPNCNAHGPFGTGKNIAH